MSYPDERRAQRKEQGLPRPNYTSLVIKEREDTTHLIKKRIILMSAYPKPSDLPLEDSP